jgi:hypothetical protein
MLTLSEDGGWEGGPKGGALTISLHLPFALLLLLLSGAWADAETEAVVFGGKPENVVEWPYSIECGTAVGPGYIWDR